MKTIKIDLMWSEGPTYCTRIIAGMQIEAWKRDLPYYFCTSHKWEYKLVGSNGAEICFGYGHTLSDIKRVSAIALGKRI